MDRATAESTVLKTKECIIRTSSHAGMLAVSFFSEKHGVVKHSLITQDAHGQVSVLMSSVQGAVTYPSLHAFAMHINAQKLTLEAGKAEAEEAAAGKAAAEAAEEAAEEAAAEAAEEAAAEAAEEAAAEAAGGDVPH